MDAYFDYNQIKVHPPDKGKTALTLLLVMPFGLKNARATFQGW